MRRPLPLDNLRTGMILFYITEPGSDSCKIRTFGIKHLYLGIAWNGEGWAGLRQGDKGLRTAGLGRRPAPGYL